MKVTIRSVASLLFIALVASAFVAIADEPKADEPSAPKPKSKPPKITYENLYQIEELVKQGADVNAPCWYARKLRKGETEHPPDAPVGAYPLDLAVGKGNPNLVKRLLELGAIPKRNLLANACFNSNNASALAVAKILLVAGMDPNGDGNLYHGPPITHAAFRGHTKVVELLLAQPDIEIDKLDIDGYTALTQAASRGHKTTVDLLLKAGADPSIKNERGNTPADQARDSIAKFEDIIKRLEE